MNRTLLWIVFSVAAIIFALFSGIAIYSDGVKRQQAAVETPSTPVPEAQPKVEEISTASTTENETVSLTKYPLKILNGSGISGEAAKVKKSLELEGFKVASIGNADQTISETTIKAHSDIPEEYIEALQKVLKKTYTVSSTIEPSSDTGVFVVTVGQSKSE